MVGNKCIACNRIEEIEKGDLCHICFEKEKKNPVDVFDNYMRKAGRAKRIRLLRKSGMDKEAAEAYSKPYEGKFHAPVMNALRILQIMREERKKKGDID